MKALVAGSVVLAFLCGTTAFAQRVPREGRSTNASPASPAMTAPAPATPARDTPSRDMSTSDQRAAQHEEATPALTVGGKVPYADMVGGKHIDYKWQENGLSSPPAGYAWMLLGDTYVLADQKSGLIKEVRKVAEQSVVLTEGGKVPYSYMVGGKYIEYKWQESGLSSPPQGYAWMRIGARFVLADQQSGLIKDVRSVDAARPLTPPGTAPRPVKASDRRP